MATTAFSPARPGDREGLTRTAHGQVRPQPQRPQVPGQAGQRDRTPGGMRVVRLRDMQRDCAVIFLSLQHYFSVALLPLMQTPCYLKPHDGSAVCPECGYRATAVVEPPFIITVPPFRKDWHVRAAGPGRGCYRVLGRGTVTVAQ